MKLNNPTTTWGANTITLKGVDTQYGIPSKHENVVTLRYSAIKRVYLNRLEWSFVQVGDDIEVTFQDYDGIDPRDDQAWKSVEARSAVKCCEFAAELARRMEASP